MTTVDAMMDDERRTFTSAAPLRRVLRRRQLPGMTRHALFPALLVVLAAGCAAQVVPSSLGEPEMTVEITHRVAEGDVGEAAATAIGGDGTVTVRGTIPTPNPCHRLRGVASEEAGTLTLVVEATVPPDVGCIAVLATLEYTATLRGIGPGRHPVRVVHRYPATGWDEARLDAGVVDVQ